ncbi:MAG TPA: hypothetical protein VFG79_14180 [Solirubrobacter sp.]|nr:hypothetical protein [Solirubrobacter sp.]
MTALLSHDLPIDPRDDRPEGGRDPAHVLYEQAAGLLATAQSLDAATTEPGTVAALAPTLACLETSLVALASATERLRGHALERLSEPVLPTDDLRPLRADVAAQLERLAGVLAQGSIAAGQAQASLEPALTELRAI